MTAAWVALGLTLKVAFWATALNVVLGVGVGYAMARLRFPGRDVLDAFLTLPMVMPPTVLGYYLLVLIGTRGPIGSFLKNNFGINLIFTWQGAVLAATVVSFPLVFKAARAAFESLDPQYEQAARVLGVNSVAVFFRVTLPLAWRGVLAGLLLAFARATGEFGATLMVAGSIPGKTQTLSIAVYEAVQAGQDETANVLVLLTSVTCMAVLLAAGRLVPGAHPGPAMNSPAEGLVWDVSLRKRLHHRDRRFDLDVSFQSRARRLVMFGPSGAGKSQTLRMLAGLVRPDAGHVRVAGDTLYSDGHGLPRVNESPQRRRLAYVFQDYALFPHLTVEQNVAFALGQGWLNPRRGSAAVHHPDVLRWMQAFDLMPLRHLHPEQLSGGQRQRTALARALVGQPRAILLDEPFAALDPLLRQRLRAELAELQARLSIPILTITHDDEDVKALAEDVIVLEAGRVKSLSRR